MKKIRNFVASLTSAVLLTGLAVTFNACSNENSLNPPEPALMGRVVQSNIGPIRILEEDNQNTLSKKGEPGWMKRLYSTEKFIEAAEGGALIVGHPKKTGQSKIFFEPFDLSEDMTIRFEWRASTTLEGVLNNAEFGPHGTNFNNPVRVELSYKLVDLSGVEEDSLRVFYFNEESNLWEFVGGEVDKAKQVVIAYLDHFSRYAIGAE